MLKYLIFFIFIGSYYTNSLNKITLTNQHNTYNVDVEDNIISCVTSQDNDDDNFNINLYQCVTDHKHASLVDLVMAERNIICITDEGGYARTNNIIINAYNTDLHDNEVKKVSYIIKEDSRTECFYCINKEWEPRFGSRPAIGE